MKKIVKIMSTMAVLALLLVGCGSGKEKPTEETAPQTAVPTTTHEKNPIVTIEMQNGKKIEVELYPDVAPNTVNNFVSLVQEGFYDGLTFHRVIPGFMIQGGDPAGNGSGGPDYSIKGEFASNDFTNDLKHDVGVISMARSGHPDSAGSQFFIMTENSPHLDGEYAAFGKVTKGMDVVNEIVSVETNEGDMPVKGKEQVIKKMTVETFGETYDAPIKA